MFNHTLLQSNTSLRLNLYCVVLVNLFFIVKTYQFKNFQSNNIYNYISIIDLQNMYTNCFIYE